MVWRDNLILTPVIHSKCVKMCWSGLHFVGRWLSKGAHGIIRNREPMYIHWKAPRSCSTWQFVCVYTDVHGWGTLQEVPSYNGNHQRVLYVVPHPNCGLRVIIHICVLLRLHVTSLCIWMNKCILYSLSSYDLVCAGNIKVTNSSRSRDPEIYISTHSNLNGHIELEKNAGKRTLSLEMSV